MFSSPYTATIPLRVSEITETTCKTTLLDSIFSFSWITKNPFGSHHAACLTNMGEATQGFAVLAFAEGNSLRAIPTKLTVEFHAKAKGTLTASSKLSPEIVQAGKAKKDTTLPVVTEIYNSSMQKVCTVTGLWKLAAMVDRKKLK